MHDKQVRRRRVVLALLVAVSLILLTAYFGETPTSPLHSVQRGVVEVLSPVESGANTVLACSASGKLTPNAITGSVNSSPMAPASSG